AIDEAAKRAQLHNVRAATFLQMDVTQSLAFEKNTFDLVHMRTASPFISAQAWPTVINELIRIVRPGGWLTIIDYEQGPTSSMAFNTITTLIMKAVRATNSSFAPATLTTGAAARLYGFLLNAYLLDVSYTIHAVDFGVRNTVDAREFVEGILAVAAQFQPLLHHLDLVKPCEYKSLIARARKELTLPSACSYGILIAAVGRKDG
ncbi:MAG: class I SAM-dependent methyltransferase, partial [Chloroflexota bacterium]|nr:class I SAM-dependent methyltransferase [Chloroflexota bacterium]